MEKYTSIKSIYTLSHFLGMIKSATDTYNDRMKTAPLKSEFNKLFQCRVASQFEVQKMWQNQLKTICNQAKSFGYTADDLGLRFQEEQVDCEE